MGDDAACRVSPSKRIWNAERDPAGLAAPGGGRIYEFTKGAFVDRQRVSESSVEKEPETPRPTARRPDEISGSALTARHLRVRITLSAEPLSRSNLNWVSVALR